MLHLVSHVSDKLSQTVSQARSIAEELKGKADIAVVDTLAGSLPQGLLVLRAAQMAAGGATRGQIVSILDNLIPQADSIFTVHDLNHLARGGRLSRAAALVGNMVAMKPLLGFTADGSLVMIDCAHGWARAVEALYQWVETHAPHPTQTRKIRCEQAGRLHSLDPLFSAIDTCLFPGVPDLSEAFCRCRVPTCTNHR